MPKTKLFHSPLFWGGLAVAAVGATVAYRSRRRLLGAAPWRVRHVGPDPVVVTHNPAAMPIPVETRQRNGMTVRRYESKKMSIDERLKLIQKHVFDGVQDGQIRTLAGQLTKHCGRDDGPCEVRAVYDAVKRRVRYSGDVGPVLNPNTGVVEAMDLYQSPRRSWSAQIADCDDHTALIASLLAVMGHTVRLRVSSPTKLGEWQHIYPVVGDDKVSPKKWIPVDVTLPWKGGVGSEARYGKARDYVTEVPA